MSGAEIDHTPFCGGESFASWMGCLDDLIARGLRVPVLPIIDRNAGLRRLHEEFRRRVKTQGSLPSEDAALVLLFSLVASGQIKLRRIDGWRKIAVVLSQHTAVAA